MLIDTKFDNHILQIEKELEDYDILEFKNMITSIFINEILPTKNDLKTIALIVRVCLDSIKDNTINANNINVNTIMEFINNNIDDANLLSFRVVHNLESGLIGFKIITNLNSSLDTYCLNEILCIDDIKYYTIDELINKMFIISIDIDDK